MTRSITFSLALRALVGACAIACGSLQDISLEPPAASDGVGFEPGGMGGPDGLFAFHLPVPDGRQLLCTQGAGGSFSHQGRSTRHDLDFDTRNDADEEVFAPASGRAHVHATAGFGTHVNVDVGGGRYVVVGHLKQAFVRGGDWVAAGQLIGYEGCTGVCTGDHVHVGVHEGDAARPAEEGVSVPSAFYVRGSDGRLAAVSGSEAVCGIPGGARYVSALPTPLWHPDGTLLKQPHRSDVYVLENGRLRVFLTEAAFLTRGHSFDDVVLMSADERQCHPVGAAVEGAGAPPAVEEPFREGALVKERGRSDVYVVSGGAALPVFNEEAYRLMGFAHRHVHELPEGEVRRRFQNVGSCVADIGCIKGEYVTRCGGLPRVDWPADPSPVDPQPQPEPEPEPDPEPEPHPEPEPEPEPQPEPEPNPEPDPDPQPEPSDPRVLRVHWDAPIGSVPDRITLSGEHRRADGSYAFRWLELMTVRGTAFPGFNVPDVRPGDTFRFSLEFQRGTFVSWSCVGPFPQQPTLHGRASATVDGTSVPLSVTGDPAGSTGCGLTAAVP